MYIFIKRNSFKVYYALSILDMVYTLLLLFVYEISPPEKVHF
jgi:hypothetical protein